MRLAMLVLTALSVTAAHADGDSRCDRQGEVTGTLVTVNASQTLQYGVTDIAITKRGRLFYSGRGVVIGQVTGTQDNGLPILEHSIYLSDGTRVRTHGDRVEQMIPTGKLENGAPCEFQALERITRADANRRLRDLDEKGHNIEASGIVSFCSDNNRNRFTLSGTVCFDD